MSDDLTVAGVDGICPSYDEHYDTVKEVVADPYGAWDAIQKQAGRIEELEVKLGLIQDEWTGAVYGDLENGVASLNAAAASDFYRRYPLVSAFGETLNRIIDGETDA